MYHFSVLCLQYSMTLYVSILLLTISEQLIKNLISQVPFGRFAFMSGELYHTNEITVLLGDDWFVKCSAKHSIEIVNRRKKRVSNYYPRHTHVHMYIHMHMHIHMHIYAHAHTHMHTHTHTHIHTHTHTHTHTNTLQYTQIGCVCVCVCFVI